MGDEKLKETILNIAKKAKIASKNLVTLSSDTKNNILKRVAQKLRERKEELKRINEKDVNQALIQGHTKAFIDRLTLTDKIIEGMAKGLEDVAAFQIQLGKWLKCGKDQMDFGLEE